MSEIIDISVLVRNYWCSFRVQTGVAFWFIQYPSPQNEKPLAPGLRSTPIVGVLDNPGAYKYIASVCVHPLCVLENGKVSNCHTGLHRKIWSLIFRSLYVTKCVRGKRILILANIPSNKNFDILAFHSPKRLFNETSD